MPSITIDKRFRGPPNSGNGGYVCGLIADHIDGSAEITLRASRVTSMSMTRSRSMNNVPNELVATYYRQRASAGLIVTEGTSPSPNGLGYPRIPGLYSSEQVQGWKLVTDAVHAKGGKIFIQFMHTGRVTHIANLPAGSEVIGPGEATLDGETFAPPWTV